jgi:hypothetical protein
MQPGEEFPSHVWNAQLNIFFSVLFCVGVFFVHLFPPPPPPQKKKTEDRNPQAIVPVIDEATSFEK